MNAQRGKLVSGGRLQVPADIRRELGLADGDRVLLRVVDGELHVRPVRAALARVQARLEAHLPDGNSLSEELLAERRRKTDGSWLGTATGAKAELLR